MKHPPLARLHLPSPALAGCIFLAAERDTRGASLADAQRFNYYPASPLPTVSWIFEGELHMIEQPHGAAAARLAEALPRVVFSGPSRRPTASWSPGPVHALSVGFHPDALARLLGLRMEDQLEAIVPLPAVASGAVLQALLGVADDAAAPPLQRVEAALRPLWQALPAAGHVADMRSWLRALAVRAAFSKTGAGLRQVQRRIKDWSGQSHRDLQLYTRTEQALAQLAALPPGQPADLAAIAADAGFADQSHFGRDVRRVTGLPPGRLEQLIRTDEAFWFYRLMMGHLGHHPHSG